MRHILPRVLLCVSAAAVGTSARGVVAESPPTIPLCPGLTVVTAVAQQDGDYESIKTVEAVTDSTVTLKYSVERTVSDMLSSKGPQLERLTVVRTVRRTDLQAASLYLQQFSSELPETVPETTAIGTSAAVLNALKTQGEAKLGIFIPFTQTKPSIDRGTHPNVYDNQMVATVTRVGKAAVPIPVIVNDAPVTLPAIQAAGDFFGDKSEFFFLDDPANPLTLQFRVGIGGVPPLSPDAAKLCASTNGKAPAMFLAGGHCDTPKGGDKDTLRVIKIRATCFAPGAQPSASAGGGRGGAPPVAPGTMSNGASALEQALVATGKADVYSVYFSFNSDAIRDESEPTLKDIAEVLRRHPTWRLAVNGHTDSIGGDQSNLDLSRRRAAAVMAWLVGRYAIAADRLATAGFGRSQPKDTNNTLEGRARNRRVELVRMP
jgi:outer membrane protein OmpA-like peptidoglycan-associated protein